jgi:hypothetical protein
LTAELTADMSVAPEIARLAGAVLLAPAPPAAERGREGHPRHPGDSGSAGRLTLGTLARELRMIAATPERWWGLVRFEPDRPVRITVEQCPAYQAWLVILPPGDGGQACDCDVATMIAGEAAEGAPFGPALRPGPVRVHGQQHGLRGLGTGYSISLHARAHRPAIEGQGIRELGHGQEGSRRPGTTDRPGATPVHALSTASCLDWATSVPAESQTSKSSSW